MRHVSWFPRMVFSVLLGGVFLASLMAGLSSQAQAASPSDETQAANLSEGMQVAASEEKPAASDKKNKEKPLPMENHPCGPPGSCNATNVSAGGAPGGCTSGNYCSNPGASCSPGMTCKTVNSGGTCYCSCSR